MTRRAPTFGLMECCDCGVTVKRTGSAMKRCAECRREAKRERDRAHYEANREDKCERTRAHYEANREAVREQQRAYREANREALREYGRAYRGANREAVREQKRCQAATLPKTEPALRHQRWSPGEDALAMDPTLPIIAVCELTGRGYQAVTARRRLLRKKQALANA